uniref:Metallothionein-like protein n=1 Tax=Zea mays TaxID=4577 RepID=A0A804N077_MAIZE
MDGYGQSRAVVCDATVPHGESQAEAAPRHEGTRGAWTAQDPSFFCEWNREEEGCRAAEATAVGSAVPWLRFRLVAPSIFTRCKMYPDMAEQVTTTQTVIMGVAPSKGGFEAAAGAENGGCKCGANCTCDPCTCK